MNSKPRKCNLILSIETKTPSVHPTFHVKIKLGTIPIRQSDLTVENFYNHEEDGIVMIHLE